MILDLHLRLPSLQKDLIWFNGNKCHFIFQFSDDGAPETSELGMSIGSLTCSNFGSRVRSREFHYLLHCLSVSEKDAVMEDLWKQHTEEMKALEGNVLTVCGQQCTTEFSQVLISLGKAGQIMSSTKQPYTLHPMPKSTKGSCVKWGNHREFQ